MKTFSRIYMGLIFALLYAPILVLVIYSFNESGELGSFSRFSFYWYKQIFRNKRAFESLKNSLFLAVTSSALATVIGTFAALGLDRMRRRHLRNIIMSVTNIPMMNPDIVTGVSMMLFFVATASIIGLGSPLGRITMLIAHTTFNIPYVILSVRPRFLQMDRSLTEAALDLGCTPARAFFKVELPFITPGIVSGLIMGFTLSLDDFVISHFVSSPDFQTLPLYIYNQTAHQVKFSMYALSTLIILSILLLLLIINFAGAFGENNNKNKIRKESRG
ncbi:MAG: ABC transporter permease [Clostridiales bacterium]|nr:ABC transporter permease [Clostridiales bacterium]